jgi:demethylmenaquinone methyltransferase/2-methoxy-6-polyprenyl-1,4-benzoquinol methylase
MAFFDWVAPVFGAFADRWSAGRIAEIAEALRPFLGDPANVLDLGGGTGALAARLAAALPARVTVLDPTPAMERYAPQRPDVIVLLGSAEHIPFEDAAFDAVVISDAFHHFRDQSAAVREIARALRPGGALFITEYDRRGLMRFVVWAERMVGEPASFFAPDELCAYLADRGIRGRCTKRPGISYDFLGATEATSARTSGVG